MKKEYPVKTIGERIIQMCHDDFEAFCENENLPIFIEKEKLRVAWFNNLIIVDVDS
jgi:hypothetical protein